LGPENQKALRREKKNSGIGKKWDQKYENSCSWENRILKEKIFQGGGSTVKKSGCRADKEWLLKKQKIKEKKVSGGTDDNTALDGGGKKGGGN